MTATASPDFTEDTVREDLAAVYRLLAHFGWDDLIHTHASAHIPGDRGELLINQYGDLFSEVEAGNLMVVNLDGSPARGDQVPMNTAGLVIHTAIHAARPDVGCVIHTHSPAGVAVSCLEEGLLPLNQIALLFYGRIGYHDFEGIALDKGEQERLAADLGDNHALILRNHGLLVVGRTVAEAFSRIYHLERACRIQVETFATGRPTTRPDQKICERTASQYAADDDGALALEWKALRRLADRVRLA